jgi:DNA repair protein RadC
MKTVHWQNSKTSKRWALIWRAYSMNDFITSPSDTSPLQHLQSSFVIYDESCAIPVAERPQARILRDGPAVCSTLELLQVVIGGPKAERAARALLDRCQDLRGIARHSVGELAGLTSGLGESKAAQLKAGLELGRRLFAVTDTPRPQIKTPADAAQLLIPLLSLLDQEEVHTMQMDTRNRVISITLLYRGSLNAASMRVSEVFKEAIRVNAAAIVIAHNHPSSDPTPSAEDIQVTKTLVNAGKLLDVDLLDHIVVGGARYVSMKERGVGFES